MKKYFILLICSLLSFSCNDWLEVQPRTEKRAEEMLSTQKGFQDALIGAYLELSHPHSYGEALTMGNIEFLASLWDYDVRTAREALAHHDYSHSDVESLMKNIYLRQYKAILAVNRILEEIDAKKAIFSTGVYEGVKGECLAIRALCHFTLLRLFGPVPTEPSATPILSYVKTITTAIHPHVDYATFKAELLKDFLEAESYLTSHMEMYNQGNIGSDFNYYYNYRFNQFAVQGLLARAYLWFGENALAHEYAMKVIEAAKEKQIIAVTEHTNSGDNYCRLGNVSDIQGTDKSFRLEHILSVYQYNLYKTFTDKFTMGGGNGRGALYFKGVNADRIIGDVYGTTGLDIRELYGWKQYTALNQAQYYMPLKYQTGEEVPTSTSSGELDQNYIPLLRLSELYFIAIETGGNSPESQALWDEYRTSRNIEKTTLSPYPKVFQQDLVAEYLKEFYGEGHMFFLYKRLKLAQEEILWMKDLEMNLNYVVPLPKTELSYAE